MAIAILEQIIFGSWIGCGLARRRLLGFVPSFLLFVGALYYYVCSIDANEMQSPSRCVHRMRSDYYGRLKNSPGA